MEKDDLSSEEMAEFNELIGEPEPEPKPEPKEELKEEPKPYVPKNDDEARALQSGLWKPKEQWIAEGGDPDEWVSARRFNLDGKKLRRIHELETEVETVKTSTKQMLEHVKATEQARFQAELKRIQDEKYAALESGDVQGFRAAEEREKTLRPPELPQQPVRNLLVEAVKEAHPDLDAVVVHPQFRMWLSMQPAMTQWQFENSTDPRDGIRVLDSFKEAAGVKPKHRETPAPSPVGEPRVVLRQKEKGTTFNDLSPGHKATFREFVRVGMFDDTPEARAEYAKDCALRGEA